METWRDLSRSIIGGVPVPTAVPAKPWRIPPVESKLASVIPATIPTIT